MSPLHLSKNVTVGGCGHVINLRAHVQYETQMAEESWQATVALRVCRVHDGDWILTWMESTIFFSVECIFLWVEMALFFQMLSFEEVLAENVVRLGAGLSLQSHTQGPCLEQSGNWRNMQVPAFAELSLGSRQHPAGCVWVRPDQSAFRDKDWRPLGRDSSTTFYCIAGVLLSE